MNHPLIINGEHLDDRQASGKVFEMTGRCAFAICTKGEFKIRILNEYYVVEEHSIFACMPFVNIEVVSIERPGNLIFGYLLIEDVPQMINRWVNTDNLTAIQNHPVVKVSDDQYERIIMLIGDYIREKDKIAHNSFSRIYDRIQQDIMELHSKLILGYVIKAFFANVPVKMTGRTHGDEVFQRFMLSLYANFREQRNVHFYAMNSGLSLKYFSTIIKKLSGKSPSEWIEKVVVDETKSMLKDNQRSIKDIAAALNFPDTPTFSKYFRRVAGLTPKSYRKAILDN